MIKQTKQIYNKVLSLKWYYQLAIILTILVLVALLIKFLIWFVPLLLKLAKLLAGFLVLLLLFTEGKIVTLLIENYKQSKQTPAKPIFTTVYHYLTEQGIVGLPISTMIFTQGVEFPNNSQGIYFIHLSKQISEELLADFEIKLRQTVKTLSNGEMDCVISLSKHEPYLAIKVRLVNSDDMLLKTIQSEEDF